MGFGGSGSGSSSINGATDAAVSNPANGEVLTWDSGVAKWTNDSSAGGPPTLANLPAGSTVSVYYSAGVWPARPTERTDITVQWIGATEANPPSQGVVGVDIWVRETI